MKLKFAQSIILFIFSFSIAYAEEAIEKLVILGAGPAGLTSAIYAGQANLSPLVIEGGECDGQLASVYYMENFPGFPEGIQGDELVNRMHLQAEKFGARFQPEILIDIDLSHSPYRLTMKNSQIIYAESIIIALGTSKRWIGLESEEALKGSGVSGSATCDAPLFLNKEVVVVGGGDAALEEALALTEFATKVTLLHRSDNFNASTYLQDRIFAHEKIHVIWNSTVEEILDVSKGRVTGIVTRNLKTKEKNVLPCEGVFVSIGRKSNVDVFKGQLEITKEGQIVIDSHSTQTNIPGVFAAGDVSDVMYRKAITAAGQGCMAALDAIRYLNASNEK